MGLEFKIKTASVNDILGHLQACDDSFIPPLSDRVNLREYSIKIAGHAVTFEAWDNKILSALVAAYFNNAGTKCGFITNVSVIKDLSRSGIASALLKMCINYAKKNNFNLVKLEVSASNLPAVNFYKKNGFTEIEKKEGQLLMNYLIR